MSGFKRIKNLDDLRDTIREVYDRCGNDRCIEELWPKTGYDLDKANRMKYEISNHEVSSEKIESFIDMIMKIFDDVCKNENVPVDSISVLYYGTVSTVFKIGDKVIKIGGYRYTSTIPNNPYIVKPLLRRFMSVDGSDNGLFIEVTEKVDDDVYATEDELYDIYSNLRDMGIEWADVKAKNVGRLLKDNVIHWNSELNPSPSTTMLDGEMSGTPLKKGDFVILDADLIYRDKAPEEYIKTVPSCYNYVVKFRERYENEHQKKPRRIKLFPEAIRKFFASFQDEDKKKK